MPAEMAVRASIDQGVRKLQHIGTGHNPETIFADDLKQRTFRRAHPDHPLRREIDPVLPVLQQRIVGMKIF